MKIRFEYLYRSGGNWKEYASIVLSAKPSEDLAELEKKIRTLLSDGQYFIAEQIKIPKARTSGWVYQADEDHYWHEFAGLKLAESGRAKMTVGEFINRLRIANKEGWHDDGRYGW